jgi:hypothetical protein
VCAGPSPGPRAPVLCPQAPEAANVKPQEAAMSIEKAFAIRATPQEIYDALDRDLRGAEAEGDGDFEVLARQPGRSLELRVTMGGIPCWLRYELKPQDDATEVTATLTPFGLRYTVYKIVTLGMRDHAFALALVQGLANLKAELEGDDGTAPDDDSAFEEQ